MDMQHDSVLDPAVELLPQLSARASRVAPHPRPRCSPHRAGIGLEISQHGWKGWRAEIGKVRPFRDRLVEVHELRPDCHHRARLADVRVEAGLHAQVFLQLLRRQGLPVGHSPSVGALGQPSRHIHASHIHREIVGVVTVDEHDPPETDLGERERDVFDHGHERRNAQIRESLEATMSGGDAVVDGGRHQRVDLLRHSAANLGGDDDVGGKRAVWPVLLGGAGRHQHEIAAFEVFLDLSHGELGHEDGFSRHTLPRGWCAG